MSGSARAPITGWQFLVLQGAGTEPLTMHSILGRRGSCRATHRPWLTQLLDAGYLLEISPAPGKAYTLYTRTALGDEAAEQLAVIADLMGWEAA